MQIAQGVQPPRPPRLPGEFAPWLGPVTLPERYETSRTAHTGHKLMVRVGNLLDQPIKPRNWPTPVNWPRLLCVTFRVDVVSHAGGEPGQESYLLCGGF